MEMTLIHSCLLPEMSEVKDDSDSKTSSVISPRTQIPQTPVQPPVAGGPYYRPLTPHDGSSTLRPHSRGTYTSAKYIASPGAMVNHQQVQPAATYYSTLPRGGGGGAYRSWNDYGSSTQFKF
ncbi:hypothetical protein AVEN_85783-1 [Araneus ventricosus]|uniref:Uncharacterized protein n=1 Tax=Araneus ventricosus TaxID=182803 RepID=A0A4Y2QDE5_ARAVE|nr:hypothetical protein AVEN_232983-1 [Araneus ventricosus]GBN60667.1 hypothetical protein AVEN_85783-1 [Araneus ventricosus]